MLTNKLNLPEPIYNALNSDYQPKEHQYSVTTILNSTRQILLKRKHNNEIVQDCSDLIYALLGTAFHSILENADATENQFQEEYLKQDLEILDDELKGYFLSGKADLVDVKRKTMIDYKTASVWKVINKDYEDYRMQLLIYAWLFRKLGFDINKGEIIAFLRDFQKSKAKFDKDYPQFQVQKIEFTFSETDFQYIENFIKNKFLELKKYENSNDDDLPICTEEERWHEPTKYAVKKKKNKQASKIHDTLSEAEEHLKNLELKYPDEYEIEIREGKNNKCESYCSCCEFCSFYRENYGRDDKNV